MDATPLIRAGTGADLAPIRALLSAAGLPVSDLARAQPRFVVACAGSEVIGAGALEVHGETALLRSLVVTPTSQGRGLGRRIVKSLERQARTAGIRELVLLTQTAQPFFAQLDYHVIERRDAPAALRLSAEFNALCPASAVCMAKALR